METATKQTTQQKFKAAMREIRKNGVAAKYNVSGCCRSCISYEAGEEHGEDHQIVWHYGGQGNRISWNSYGQAISKGSGWRGDSAYGVAYLNHSLTEDNAKMVVAVFERHGLTVDWDGSEWQCIGIVLNPSDVEND